MQCSDEFGPGEIEMLEIELAGEAEAQRRPGDEWRGSKRDEGAAARFRELTQAMPGGGGDASQFACGKRREVEQDEGQVAIAQEQVG